MRHHLHIMYSRSSWPSWICTEQGRYRNLQEVVAIRWWSHSAYLSVEYPLESQMCQDLYSQTIIFGAFIQSGCSQAMLIDLVQHEKSLWVWQRAANKSSSLQSHWMVSSSKVTMQVQTFVIHKSCRSFEFGPKWVDERAPKSPTDSFGALLQRLGDRDKSEEFTKSQSFTHLKQPHVKQSTIAAKHPAIAEQWTWKSLEESRFWNCTLTWYNALEAARNHVNQSHDRVPDAFKYAYHIELYQT